MTLLRLFAAGVVSMLLLEGMLGVFDFPRFDACQPPSPSPWQMDAETFRTLRPGVQIGVGRTNSLGLRGPEIPTVRTPGTARILYIGDSTCWGLGVGYERTFAALAAELATERLGRPVEIVNGCIPGHSSFQARAMLRRLLRFGPDAVIFYVGARNDVDRHRYFRDADIPTRIARLETRWHRVRLFQAIEAAWDGFYKKLLRKPLSLARRARVSPKEFQENLAALLDAASVAGARSVVLMPPWSASLLERYPLIPEYQRILAETARAGGAVLVPLQSAFSPRRESSLYQEDRLHFNEKGHAAAARELVPAIVSALAASTD